MDKLYIVIPAYNEAENIEGVINDWYSVIEKHSGNGESRLVVINDGSKDNTYEIIKKCSASRPKLIALTKKNGGHGSTVLYGYKYAIKNGADYIFQTDSDGQTSPLEFEKFWNLRNTYDAILGNRRYRQDGILRVITEGVLRFVLLIVFGIGVPDANAPYRLMKREIIAKYINMMEDDYNLPNVMLTTFLKYYGEKIIFLEISFEPRKGGVNSINMRKIIKIGWKAMADFKMFRRNM